MEDKLIDEIFRAWARVQYHHETGEWLPPSSFNVKKPEGGEEDGASAK